MARDCSLDVRLAGATGMLLIALVAGCRPGDTSRRDSTLARSARSSAPAASAERPKVRGEKARKTSNAGDPDDSCAGYDTTAANPAVQFSVADGMQSDSLESYVSGLCFAVDQAQIDKWHRLARIWIQPEMRMHHTNPQVANGWGMVVAKIRNEKIPGLGKYPRHWKRSLDRGHDALLWYGMDADTTYAVLFELQNGRVREISRGTWRPENIGRHTIATAEWNPPHESKTGAAAPGKRFDHHNGSGWISCTLGCCTAVGVNGEEPADEGGRR